MRDYFRQGFKTVLLAALLGPTCASANTLLINATGTANGNPVHINITFTTGPGTLDISVVDLQANPTADTQPINEGAAAGNPSFKQVGVS